LQKAGNAAPTVELFNRATQEADPAASLRTSHGTAKVMPDADMALLIEELADHRFFEWAVPESQPPGSRSGLVVEINGNRRLLSPTATRAASLSDSLEDLNACGNIFRTAFNATFSFALHEKKIEGMTGEEYFMREKERLQRQAEESVRKARQSEGGR
jgi:hypothetical protein